MKRIARILPFCAATFGVVLVGLALAHDGHDHGQGQGEFSALKSSPSDSRFEFRPPAFSPLDDAPFGRCVPGGICDGPHRLRRFNADIRPERLGPEFRRDAQKRTLRDLKTLAFRLEYASEIVSEEIRFEFPPTRFASQLLASAADVEKHAAHFRSSVEQGADAAHLQKDFRAVTDSFTGLVRPLRRFHAGFLVERAMVRVDGLLGDIARHLKNGQPVANGHQPMGPQQRPSATPAPTIPEQMKGIALLPPEDQAAAIAQRTCPVTVDLLGSLGKPFKVEVLDRTVFVCCEGCVADLTANPEKFLANRP